MKKDRRVSRPTAASWCSSCAVALKGPQTRFGLPMTAPIAGSNRCIGSRDLSVWSAYAGIICKNRRNVASGLGG